MRPVVIESPYAGDVETNLRYLRACLADSLSRGEAPFASHAIYTQPGVLRDDIPAERSAGIMAGFEWRRHADLTAVYIDLGVSVGMLAGLRSAMGLAPKGHHVVLRRLGGEWAKETVRALDAGRAETVEALFFAEPEDE